jgi:hypothetical protein
VCTRAACLQASAQVSRSACTKIWAHSWNYFTACPFTALKLYFAKIRWPAALKSLRLLSISNTASVLIYVGLENVNNVWLQNERTTSALDGVEWPVSRPGRFTPGTYWVVGWTGPRAGLDAVVNWKALCPIRESNPGRPARSQSHLSLKRMQRISVSDPDAQRSISSDKW